jgi:hypothetical protein
MASAFFRNNWYEFCDNGNYVLFTANKTHDLLFDYVPKDLSKLSELFERYISKKMDTATFILKDFPDNDTDADEIIKILKSLHPYYEFEYESVFIKAVGEYLNSLLFDSYRRIQKLHDKEWYLDRLKVLMAPLWQKIEPQPTMVKFYNKYRESVYADRDENIEEYFLLGQLPAIGFYRELATHKAISNMLFWVLDLSAPVVSGLKIAERAWIYDHMTRSDITVSKHLLFKSPFLHRKNIDYPLEQEHLIEMYDILIPIRKFGVSPIKYENAPPEIINALASAADYAKRNFDAVSCEQYEINNLEELLYLEVVSMIQNDMSIKKCRNCGKYFAVDDLKKEYCDRIAHGETKPCSIIGSQRTYQNKVKAEPALMIYNRAYKTHSKRVKNGAMTQDEFLVWRMEAKQRLGQVRGGEFDIAEFEMWLKK